MKQQQWTKLWHAALIHCEPPVKLWDSDKRAARFERLWDIVKLLSLKLSDGALQRGYQTTEQLERRVAPQCVRWKYYRKGRRGQNWVDKSEGKDCVCRFHPSLYFFPIQCLPSWHPGIHASPPQLPTSCQHWSHPQKDLTVMSYATHISDKAYFSFLLNVIFRSNPPVPVPTPFPLLIEAKG